MVNYRNTVCKNKTCSSKFHACSSCCLSSNWEYEYCSSQCWIEDNQDLIDKYVNWINSLSNIDKSMLLELLIEIDDEIIEYITTKYER